MKKVLGFVLMFVSLVLYANGNKEAFHQTVEYVDMDLFSGDWYVIALIPTRFEKGASEGIENYSLDSKGHIRVQYTFKKDEKEKVMYQKGWIYNKDTNADWRVRPLWPLKLPYYIIELDEDYSYTVIATKNYKYLWIMARTSSMEPSLLEDIFDRMAARGFEREKIILMEQNGALK